MFPPPTGEVPAPSAAIPRGGTSTLPTAFSGTQGLPLTPLMGGSGASSNAAVHPTWVQASYPNARDPFEEEEKKEQFIQEAISLTRHNTPCQQQQQGGSGGGGGGASVGLLSPTSTASSGAGFVQFGAGCVGQGPTRVLTVEPSSLMDLSSAREAARRLSDRGIPLAQVPIPC